MQFFISRSLKRLQVVFIAGLVSIVPLSAKEPLKVITTFTIVQDMAQNVAGDRADVESIIKPGVDLHDYQPTPKDIAKVEKADLILWNGLEMENWFERFFESSKEKPSKVVSDGIVVLMDSEDGHGGQANPHAWMSLKNGLIYVDNICDALIEYDPDNAESYQENAKAYKKRIQALDKHFRKAFKEIPKANRWIVTNESSMTYFADRYGFKTAYLWSAMSDEEGTPRQVRDLIDTVRKEKIPVLFSESTMSDRSIKQVVKETGAKYGGKIYTDTLTNEEGAVPTYLDLMDVTGNIILKAFDESE